jgi:hypothetical protein
MVLGGSETFNATYTPAGVTVETIRFIGFENEIEEVDTVDEVN